MNLPVEFKAEVLGTENKEYVKDGETKHFYKATFYHPVSGACVSFSVSDLELLKKLEGAKRTEINVYAEYNPDYKSIRVVGLGYDD